MIVELNDAAFKLSKKGDIFVIEEKNKKKYAKPVNKFALFKEQFEQLEDCQLKFCENQKKINELQQEIIDFKQEINRKLDLIAKIVGGYNE